MVENRISEIHLQKNIVESNIFHENLMLILCFERDQYNYVNLKQFSKLF